MVENIDILKDTIITQKSNNKLSYIKCTYEIKDQEKTQILNYRSENYTNEEIESKIKILNGDKIEELIFKKKFEKIGINSIYFLIEESLSNLSYLFYKCSTLKDVKFFNFNTSQAIKMRAMFVECSELEYLDLSEFDTSNVTDFSYMFDGCHKLKEIKGINNFNTCNVENIYAMFQGCKELEYLDLSNFSKSK